MEYPRVLWATNIFSESKNPKILKCFYEPFSGMVKPQDYVSEKIRFFYTSQKYSTLTFYVLK